MTTIRLVDISPQLASRGRARKLREQLVATVESAGQPSTFDFDGVLGVSDSFADELFAVTARMYGEQWFREWVLLTNVSDVVRGAIVRAIRLRLAGDHQPQGHVLPQGFEIQPPPDELMAEAVAPVPVA